MREEDVIEHVDVRPRPCRERRAHEIAEAVDGTAGGIGERRDEECAREMRRMVLDMMHGRQCVAAYAKRGGKRAAHIAHPPPVSQPVPHERDVGTPRDGVPRLSQEMGTWIPAHGDMIHGRARDTALLQHGLDRHCGEPRAVLDAPEPLLLHRRDEDAIAHEHRRHVAVVRVDPDDVDRPACAHPDECSGRRSWASAASYIARSDGAMVRGAKSASTRVAPHRATRARSAASSSARPTASATAEAVRSAMSPASRRATHGASWTPGVTTIGTPAATESSTEIPKFS